MNRESLFIEKMPSYIHELECMRAFNFDEKVIGICREESLLILMNNSRDYSEKELATLHYIVALTYYVTSEFEVAIEYLHKSQEYFGKVSDKQNVIQVYQYLSLCLLKLGEDREAKGYFLKAEAGAKEHRMLETLSVLYIDTCSELGKNDSSNPLIYVYLQRAIKVLNSYENERSSMLYVGLGIINLYYKDFATGIIFYFRSLELSRKYNDKKMEATSLYYIGIGYLEFLNKGNKGLLYLERLFNKSVYHFMGYRFRCAVGMQICYAYNKKGDVATAKKYLNIIMNELVVGIEDVKEREQFNASVRGMQVEIQTHTHSLEENIGHLMECRKVYGQYKNNFKFIHFDVDLDEVEGNVYYANGEFGKALSFHQSALKKLVKYDLKNRLAECYKLIAEDYEALGDFTEALFYLKKYDEIKIMIYKDEAFKSYEALHQKLEVEEKERRLSKLREANEELEVEVYLDSLTGVYNRGFLEKFLEEKKASKEEEKDPMSVMMIDIDYFKEYNDHYGHVMGDEALKDVASGIVSVCERQRDLVVRYGGDEFVVVLQNTGTKNACFVASKLKQYIHSLNLPHELSVGSRRITLSIGISTIIPRVSRDYDMLFENADKMLYYSKKRGRDIWTHDSF